MKKRIIALVLSLCMAVSLFAALPARAAEETDWKTLYKQYILDNCFESQDTTVTQYGTCYCILFTDLNNDGTPEMLDIDLNFPNGGYNNPVSVGTIQNDQVVYFPDEGFRADMYIDRKTGKLRIIAFDSSTMRSQIVEYSLDFNKLTYSSKILMSSEAVELASYTFDYFIEGKKVSKEEYERAKKRLTDNLYLLRDKLVYPGNKTAENTRWIPYIGKENTYESVITTKEQCAQSIDKAIASYEKTFLPQVTSIKLDYHSQAISANVVGRGDLFSLKATVAPNNAKKVGVLWLSSNPGVASVSQDGYVTAYAGGQTNIIAVAKDGSGVMDVCALTVRGYISMRVGKTKTFVNGKKGTIDDAGTMPFITGRRAMLPLRFVSEKMGAQVSYLNDKLPIIVSYGSKTLEITLGSKVMTITENGKTIKKTLDVAAQKKSGKTYIPLRAIGEALGFQIYYDNASQIILASYPKMSAAEKTALLNEAKGYIK